DPGPAVVDARLAEERQAKELLADLHERGVTAPDFPDQLHQLRISVLDHAKREARYDVPRLRAHLHEATGRRLGTALRAAEADAPTRPHPGVETATANVVAPPALAVLDRIRDGVRAGGRGDETGTDGGR